MTRSRIPVLAAVIALLGAAPAAASDKAHSSLFAFLPVQDPSSLFGNWSQDEARQEAQQGRRISSDEALSRVRSRAGRGRHVSVRESRGNGGRLVWVVRWDYGDGRIVDFRVDGQTGSVSGG